MGYHYRWTMQELKETTNKTLILALISERKSSCTNYYSPLYKRLTELEKWVEQNTQTLTHLKEACKYALSVFESMPEEHAERLADVIDENIDLDILKQAIAEAEKD